MPELTTTTVDDCGTDGWVTFQTLRMDDGRVLLVQKNDGCTRTISAGGQR